MSIDLSVPVTGELSIQRVLGDSSRRMQEMLRQPLPIPLALWEVSKGQWAPASQHAISAGKLFILRTVNEPVVSIELMLSDFPVELWEGRSTAGNSADITARGTGGDPLNAVLAAAVAVAISETQERLIYDDGLVWVDEPIVATEDFLRRLQLTEVPADIETAARAFTARMNSGREK